MKRHAKLTLALALAATLTATVGGGHRNWGAEPAVAPSSVVFSSHLAEADRQVFYHLEEGSEIFPLDWILALNRAGTQQPFLQNAERLGLIADDDNPANPSHLPIGITAAT